MSNIYLKVTIEKNRPTQNLNSWSLKSSSSGQFLGNSNSHRYHWTLKLPVQLKNQRSGSKTMCGFSIIFTLKGIMTF